MIKNKFKFIVIISIIISILPSIHNCTYAANSDVHQEVIKVADEELVSEEEQTDNLGLGDLSQYKGSSEMKAAKIKAESIIGIIQTFGVALSVIALIAIGIKYMLGSVEEKADYKKTLIPYLVGAFMLFAVSLLPQLIYDLLEDFH